MTRVKLTTAFLLLSLRGLSRRTLKHLSQGSRPALACLRVTLCRQQLITALFLLACTGCVKDILLDEEFSETKLVVNCLLDVNAPVTVFVTRSGAIDGNFRIQGIGDAVVELFVNDSLTAVLPYVYTDSAHTFGSYIWYQQPVEGNKYAVRVFHPQYGTATAEDRMPLRPAVNQFEILQYGDSTNAYITKFRYTMQDNGTVDDYYRVNIWNEGLMITGIQAGDTSSEPLSRATRPEPLVELTDTLRDYTINFLFTDKNFSGSTKELVFQFKDIDLSIMHRDTLNIAVGTVSKVHYDFMESIDRANASNYGYESVDVVRNINNGYGIFMSQNMKRFILPRK